MYYSRTIDRDNWQTFFSELSRTLSDKGIDITILSEGEVGHQSTSWSAFGLTYDPHDQTVTVSSNNQEHVIENPLLVRTEESAAGIHAVEVTRKDSVREIIEFLRPLGHRDTAHPPSMQ
jgi:hypothetical protein